MSRNGTLGKWAVVVALTIGLAAGAAWAMESQSVPAPASTPYTVDAQIVPGASGADVFSGMDEMYDDHVEFSVDFGDDLLLSVNGVSAGPFVPTDTYTVTVVVREVGGDWLADTTIVNDSLGQTVFTQVGHDMGGQPSGFCARALSVLSLTAE